jgi:hypothetical protein
MTLEEIDRATWEEFESYLLALFHVQGYKAELTPNGADFGADLTLERGGKRTVVQAKHWHNRQVGVKAVQEISAAKAHYKATKAMVVITDEFTAQAIQLAHSNGIELWDREKLAKVIDGLGAKEPAFRSADATTVASTDPVPEAAPVSAQAAPVFAQAAPAAVEPQAVPISDPSTWLGGGTAGAQTASGAHVAVASLTAPACPLCASPMMQRSSKYGQFWGCSQYPDCQGKSS